MHVLGLSAYQNGIFVTPGTLNFSNFPDWTDEKIQDEGEKMSLKAVVSNLRYSKKVSKYYVWL